MTRVFFFERKNNRVVCIIEYFTGLLTYDLELTDTCHCKLHQGLGSVTVREGPWELL